MTPTQRRLAMLSFVALGCYTIGWETIEESVRALRHIPAEAWAFFSMMQCATIGLIGYQWHQLLAQQSLHTSFVRITRIQLVGTFIESVTPAAKIGGEATKLYLLKREFPTASIGTLGAVALLQKWYSMTAFIATIGLFFLFIVRSTGPLDWTWQRTSTVGLSIGGVVVVVVAASVRFFPDRWKSKVHEEWRAAKTTVRQATVSKRDVACQAFLALVIWLLYPLKGYVLAHLFDLSIGVAPLLTVIALSYIAAQLPITPGGIGTFEGVMTASLVHFGTDVSDAFAYTIVFRFMTHWFVVLVALVATWQMKGGIRHASTE